MRVSAIRKPAPAVRGADKDRDEVQHQTELQERALDGIDSALDDLEVMSKVAPPPTAHILLVEHAQLCTAVCMQPRPSSRCSLHSC
jgi:hypothetical protein